MGLLDGILGGMVNGGANSVPQSGAGIGQGAMAALLPVVLSMLRSGGQGTGGVQNDLGNVLGRMLNGGSGAAAGGLAGLGDVLGNLVGGGGTTSAANPLGALLQQFQQAGLGDAVTSWVGTGQNQPINAQDIGKVFGSDGVSAIARHAGVSENDAMSGLAALMPQLVDQLTPNGQMPGTGDLENSVSGLLQSFGKA